MTATVPFFEATGIHKRFGHRVVLEDISLSFKRGQLAGIMGPNGAGKTTCFNVLTGHLRPNRGRVVFGGSDVTGLPPRTMARLGIGRSFQQISLFDAYSTIANVMVALSSFRSTAFDPVRDVARDTALSDGAAAMLGRVGLSGREHVAAKTLSFGDRRRLDIAIALAGEPSLLFLDEPTSGLSSGAVSRLFDLIVELREATTIVVIEHNMSFLFSLADYISVIHWGQVIAQGTPNDLRDDPWVRASNLGQLA